MSKRKSSSAAVKKTLDVRVDLRISEREKAAYLEAASRQGISMSHWLRLAARTVLKDNDGKVELVQLDD
jgi:predicted HicB family RNase H-like nuclease